MSIEILNKENYNILVQWYIKWNLPITPFSYIPKNSYIVGNTCAGFLYRLDNTPLFWIEGIISDPNITNKELKKEALNILISTLEDIAKKEGGELLMTSTPRENLNNIFLSKEFKNTPEKYFHLAKRI